MCLTGMWMNRLLSGGKHIRMLKDTQNQAEEFVSTAVASHDRINSID